MDPIQTINKQPEQKNISVQDTLPVHRVKNIYPAARHIILILCILFAISFILFLINQNGKSIYDNGL